MDCPDQKNNFTIINEDTKEFPINTLTRATKISETYKSSNLYFYFT